MVLALVILAVALPVVEQFNLRVHDAFFKRATNAGSKTTPISDMACCHEATEEKCLVKMSPA